MKAVVMRELGGPDVLEFAEVPTPRPEAGEVLVRVRAVSVNRTLDLKVREGSYHVKPALPHVLGVDPAGVIDRVGPDAPGVSPGMRVAVLSTIRCGRCPNCLAGQDSDCAYTEHIGVQRWGGYAEYVRVPVSNVVPVPDSLPFPEATIVTRHFPAAFNLLENKARLQAGEWVLVMGAAGALGSCAVQVAKHLGARTIAAAGSDERVQSCLDHGADFAVNYRSRNLAEEVLRITDGHGVDVVAENIGDPTLWPGAFASLAFHGRLVTAGAHGGGIVPLDVRKLYLQRIQIIGCAGGNRRDVDHALEVAAGGALQPVIGARLPLAAAAEAHRIVAAGGVIGKVILEP